MKSGKLELRPEPVSLPQLIDVVREFFTVSCQNKLISLETRVARDVPTVMLDPGRVQQIVLNLLSNVIKFTPQSGKVQLLVARSADGGQLVSVRDNGPGIPEEEIATVLSSFGQGSLAQKTAEQGAGLGLPIVQKIMDLHQGRFDLFSKLRFGTEVIATFPRARVMDALAPVVAGWRPRLPLRPVVMSSTTWV